MYDWLAHLYLDPIGRHHPLYPPFVVGFVTQFYRVFSFFWQFSRVPWLSFVLRVALTPLALLAVRSPRNNCPLLTPHRYYYPSLVETYVTPGTYLYAGP